MNICYLIRSLSNRGGTENYVYTMTMALTKMGHQVHIVSTTGPGQWDFGKFKDKIIFHQVPFKEHPFRSSWRLEKLVPLYSWRYGLAVKKALRSIVKNHAIDLIESPDWGGDAWACIHKIGVPICVRLHGYPKFKEDFDNGYMKKFPKNYLLWSLLRNHVLHSDLVTAVSQSYADLALKMWVIKKKMVHIIPIGIDFNVFHPSTEAREEKTILFAGRLELSKGIEVLAKAIPLILDKYPEAKCYLAGRDFSRYGSPQTWSQYLINRFGKDKIIYLGALETQDLVRQYQSATMCIAPSLYEPGGTVALEAMACGSPVILTKVGGFTENIKDGQTGLFIPPEDAQALANAILKLFQNRNLKESLAQQGLEFVRDNFGIEKIAQKTLDVYAQTIKNHKDCFVA